MHQFSWYAGLIQLDHGTSCIVRKDSYFIECVSVCWRNTFPILYIKTHILTIRFSHTFATHMKYVPNMPLCGITLSMLYFTVDHATSIQLWIFSAFLNGRKQIVWRPGVSCTIWRKSNNMLDILQYLTILSSPIPYWDNIYYDLKLQQDCCS